MKAVVDFFFEIRIGIAKLFHWDRRDARFIVLLGGPGSGKDTLAGRLAPKLNLPQLNMGSILRQEIADGTPIGRKWGPRIKAGQLVPDRVIMKLLRQELAKPKYNGGAVLNGIPRTKHQASGLRWLLAGLGNRIEAAIFLDVPRADILERLAKRRETSGRDDDKPEVVLNRLDEFARTFPPLRRYYERLGLLKVILSTNAKGPDKVFDEVAFYLEETI